MNADFLIQIFFPAWLVFINQTFISFSNMIDSSEAINIFYQGYS